LSLCHPDEGSVSCGACCGLFNLKLDTNGYKTLLSERTLNFHSSVNFNERHTIAAYRQDREKIEQSFLKNDETTYNCPYLGYVDKKSSKIGCMIHPIFTGDPKSQNFSIYGTSICQAYDCKNKEHLASTLIESFINRVARDSVEYSHLASDHILFFVIQNWLSIKSWSLSEGFLKFESLILEILELRLKKISKYFPTSFEIRFENFISEEEIYSYFYELLGEDMTAKMKNAPARV